MQISFTLLFFINLIVCSNAWIISKPVFANSIKLRSTTERSEIFINKKEKSNSLVIELPQEFDLKQLSENEFQNKILESKGLKLVLFSSTWCGPCKVIQSSLKSILQTYNSDVDFFEIDTDHNFEVVNELNIRSIPSIALFKDGTMVSEIVGSVPISTISNQINKYLEL